MLFENAAISAAMVVLCVTVHAIGIGMLSTLWRSERSRPFREGRFHARGFSLVAVVFCLLGFHTIEVTAYAGLYSLLNQFPDFETSLYFSGTTFTTLGYGDVEMGPDHRLLAAVESLIGLILIGWSTAFLVTITGRLLGDPALGTESPAAPAPQGRDSP